MIVTPIFGELNWHQKIPQVIVLVVGMILIVQAYRHLRQSPQKILCVGLAVAVVTIISIAVIAKPPDGDPAHITLAWPWHFPIGTAMTFITGYLVGNKTKEVAKVEGITGLD